ncbi:uncharacterized protein LOC130974958 [Arachis stenosperma]|uniref:uncharacterized protein LOC130974958 n=1 Tax=Arachis stenosperma TaxID=217475 RepID=UPI0025AC6831|nr:uncharacterized protein LOC130974958 [Arachis stenosperma]
MDRMSLDHPAGGSIHMRKTIGEAQELIETVVTNQHLYSSPETSIKGEVKAVAADPNPPEQDGPLTQQLHAYAQQMLELQLVDDYKAKMSFPQKLYQDERDKQFARFADYLRTLEIKIPFEKALEQIPSYAKFMKNILSHKKDWRETQTVLLTEEVHQPNTCFLIRKLCLTEKVKPTRMCLQLADGSIKIPSGVIEDMIVRVGPFAFITAFVVLDMKGHTSASLILGRPFLVTGRILIDVKKGKVTLRVNKEKFVLNVVKPMQHPNIPEECMSIDFIDSLVEEVNMAESFKEGLDDILDDTQSD